MWEYLQENTAMVDDKCYVLLFIQQLCGSFQVLIPFFAEAAYQRLFQILPYPNAFFLAKRNSILAYIPSVVVEGDSTICKPFFPYGIQGARYWFDKSCPAITIGILKRA